MAFRKKADIILMYKPDILIIQECEHIDKLFFNQDTLKPTEKLWFGSNINKGIAIFSFGKFKFKVLNEHNIDLKLIIPLSVTDGCFNFNLFAIWANNPTDKDGRYVTQIWKAIQHYDNLIKNEKTILIGDFNSNTIWDRPRREGNHSAIVKRLETKSIYSVYHSHFNQIQGTEQHPTLYLYRNKNKPYHIDYCFASKDMIERLSLVEIGDYDSWIKFSDHVPMVITFDDNKVNPKTSN